MPAIGLLQENKGLSCELGVGSSSEIFFAQLNPIHASLNGAFDGFEQPLVGVGVTRVREVVPVRDVTKDGAGVPATWGQHARRPYVRRSAQKREKYRERRVR